MKSSIAHVRPGAMLLAATLALSVGSCTDDWQRPAGDDDTRATGSIALALEVDPTVDTATRASLQQIAADITADTFTITLTSDDGQSTQCSYADFTGENIVAGSYTLKAHYGEEGAEGFDHPYFLAQRDIEVRGETVTDVALTATLANAAVVVAYTDAFRAYLGGATASVRTDANPDGLTYPDGRTDELFVNPGAASLYVTFTTPQGSSATLKAADFVTVARHRYMVTVDVNNGEAGTATLTVTFDDTTVSDTREFTLSDELLTAPAPVITPESLAFAITQGATPEGNASFSIVAESGLAEVTLTTAAPTLVEQGWPARLDLLKATPEQQQLLTGLGLEVAGLWKNPGKMALVDLAGVLPNIGVTAGSDNVNTFTLEVVDLFGKTTETPAALTLTIEPLAFTVLSHNEVSVGAGKATLSLSWNGSAADLQRYLHAEFYDRLLAVWRPSTMTDITETAPGTYDITFDISPDANQVRLQLWLDYMPQPEVVEFDRAAPDFHLAISDSDIFSHDATLTLSSANADIEDLRRALSAELSTDGGNTWSMVQPSYDGDIAHLTDLLPATEYTLRMTVAGVTDAVTFTTEAGTPLADGGMEQWTRTPGETEYWWVDLPASPWGTVNQLTTSQGGSTTTNNAILTRNAYRGNGAAVCTSSGTQPTGNAFSGTQAALLTTVGWGDGNQTPGTLSNRNGICQNVAAAELYLGSWDEATQAPSYGIAWTARPHALSFRYIYEPKNGADYGLAEITVSDAEGNTLATASEQLTDQAEYTLLTLPLTYPVDSAKAATISVRFTSSANEACLTTGTDNLTTPGQSYSSRFEGSKLYLDDITLIY